MLFTDTTTGLASMGAPPGTESSKPPSLTQNLLTGGGNWYFLYFYSYEYLETKDSFYQKCTFSKKYIKNVPGAASRAKSTPQCEGICEKSRFQVRGTFDYHGESKTVLQFCITETNFLHFTTWITFSDDFEFAGTIRDKHREIGNAVPPPLGKVCIT